MEKKWWRKAIGKLGLMALAVMWSAASLSAQVFSPPRSFPNGTLFTDSAGNINLLTLQGTSPRFDLLFSRSTNGGAAFSAAVNLSNDGQVRGFSPPLIDASGNIYVMWDDLSPGVDSAFFSHSTDGGNTFSAPVNVSGQAGPVGGANFAVDVAGNIDVVWEGTSPEAMFFAQSKDGGVTFSAPMQASGTPGPIHGLQVAVDSNGMINLAWGAGNTVVFVRSTDGGATFSPLKFLPSSGEANAPPPQMALGPSGNIYILFSDQNPWALRFDRSTDGGNTFSQTVFAFCSIFDSCSKNPSGAMAIDGNGVINLVWSDGAAPFFTRSTDGGATFATSSTVANLATNQPQIGIDAAGAISLAWQNAHNANGDVFFSRSLDQGGSFSAPQNISNDGLAQAGQMAVDPQGNVNISWLESPGNTTFRRGVLLNSLSVQPTAVVGGNPATGSVTLSGPTYSDVTLSLSSAGSPVENLPTSATVTAGATSGSFTLTPAPVSSQAVVTITASDGVEERTSTLTVLPPSLSGFGVNPSAVTGRFETSIGTVTLNGPAPDGGMTVALSSSDPTIAQVPSSVSVAAGATTVSFSITTSKVHSPTNVDISASMSGVTDTVTLTVNPHHIRK